MFPLRAGIHQQRHLLRRPPPPVRPLHQVVPQPRPGPGPLWPRRHPRGEFFTHSTHCLVPLHVHYTTSTTLSPTRGRMPAGAVGRASPSRRPATRWSASSSPSTLRWSTRRAKRALNRRAARSRGPASLSRHWWHHSSRIGESVCPCASAWGFNGMRDF